MSARILFIINPAAGAGRGLERWRRLEAQAQKLGIQPDHRLTAKPEEARQWAAQAAQDYDLIAAVGGDGTAMDVANGILSCPEPRAALAVLPVGTGNDLAANLGFNGQLKILLPGQGRTRAVDVLEVKCQATQEQVTHHALVLAGVGLLGECLRRTNPTLKRVFGSRLAYSAGVAWALCRWRPTRLRVAIEDQVFENRFLLASASNGERAGGGMRLAPGALMDDGLLNVTLVEAVGRLEALRQLAAVRRGTHIHHPSVRCFMATSLRVESEPPCLVAADGEILGHTPVSIQLLPRKLSVLIPA
jgi:diacylglycerol kinase (ATP)